MKAGFARVCINPPHGTRMMGFGDRDLKQPSEGVRDDIFVRALYIEHEGEEALIISYDMCFIGRHDSDRFKGAIGNLTDMTPRQIVLASSHNHVGPASGTWAYGALLPSDNLYIDQLEQWTHAAASEAVAGARPVKLLAGAGRSKVPMNRRKVLSPGQTANRPNPGGIVCDLLPVMKFVDESNQPVAVVFSISAHPSIMGGPLVSGEYPGAACKRVDDYLGQPCSMFLQGCAGDAKTSIAGANGEKWEMTWEIADAVGAMLGDEVIDLLKGKTLTERQPEVATALTETFWPLEHQPTLAQIKELAAAAKDSDLARVPLYPAMMKLQLQLIERGTEPAKACSVLMQGVQVAQDVRLAIIEGEPVAEHGLNMIGFYGKGVTFPLGYANGEAMYLPVTRQLPEKGYEVTSGLEYSYLGQLAPGMEKVVTQTLESFRDQGIH